MGFKPELLAPAGNLEKLKMAVLYGADAVYCSGEAFGLRAAANNFTLEEMKEGVEFAHRHQAKVYVTVNIIAHNAEINAIDKFLLDLAEAGVDALLIADPGILALARRLVPQIPIHLSTQANNTNWASVNFWAEQGVERVVLARELSLPEIREIRAKTEIELEMFVHGAMCISYSGRCLMSNYFTHRDANRGLCAHPCRWKYYLMEETRPGEYFPVFEDEHGTFIFNSKDLCLLENLPEIIESGVQSLKIEGRMKSIHYVATIVRVYRQAIDSYYADPDRFVIKQEWLEEIAKVSHRPYTQGFFSGKPDNSGQNYLSNSYEQTHDFVGLVLGCEDGLAIVEERNKIQQGEALEFVGPETPIFEQKLEKMWNEEGEEITVAPHPQQIIKMPVLHPVRPGDMVRRRITK